MTTNLAIAIDLDQLRNYMREFIDERAPDSSSVMGYEWRFETFLQWLKNRQGPVDNLLTFRIEKGAGMGKYRKKPVVIEAEQFHGARIGQDTSEWIDSFPRGVCFKGCSGSQFPHLHTIHQEQIVDLVDGDWVIPESDGEHFYPCKPDVFAATYEKVED